MKKLMWLFIFLLSMTTISNAIQYVPTGQVTNQSVVPGKTATQAFNYLYRTTIPKGGLEGQVWISLGTTDIYGQTNGYWGFIDSDAFQLMISDDDTTPGYGEDKVIAGSGIVITVLNPGANEQLSISTYVTPTVSLGSDVTTEQGGTVVNPTISWDVNKTMTSIVLSRADLGTIHSTTGGDGSYPHTSTFTSTKTYSILVGDGTSTASDSKVYNFYWGKYLGMSETESGILDAEILTFTKTLSTSFTYSEVTLNPAGEKYIWYCFPASWSGEPKFYLGGFDTGGWVEETRVFVNASGGSTTYRMFRSPNKYTIAIDFRVISQ